MGRVLGTVGSLHFISTAQVITVKEPSGHKVIFMCFDQSGK